MTPVTRLTTQQPVTPLTSLTRRRPRAVPALVRGAATTMAILATTSATGAYAAVATAGAGRGRTRHATPAALARVVGPALAALSLPEVTARITTAIDRQLARVTALAAQVGTSERLSVAQRARATERLAQARADLTELRAEVSEQTSGEGLARVLDEAHRHRVFWRNWTLEGSARSRVHPAVPAGVRPGAA